LDDVVLPDPYYGESDGFEKVLDLVEKQAVLLMSRWSLPN
jgi:protein-tyrosine-phosphatase